MTSAIGSIRRVIYDFAAPSRIRLLVYVGGIEEDEMDTSLFILASTPFICSLISWYPS
ncbi:MAG TPA: hypothetical protein VFR94_14140 [Nitrososphaeraceae archaeon]|nr:hypothetical protein [Nitrososphaeraceae archaeon]